VLGHFGYRRFAGNPQLCENCIRGYTNRTIRGAVIPLTLLFADIRGSTTLGERLSPGEFRLFLEHFYRIGSDVILHHGGIVDKLVGDEIVALFIGGIAGPQHAAAGIAAGRDLLARCGAADATPMGPIPVGAGVHTGEAYVGIVGTEDVAMDFTAIGDPVNTTARLASAAGAGELLITADAARGAGIDLGALETRMLDVRGRTEAVEVVVEAIAQTG
jgi:adenylate cyclase